MTTTTIRGQLATFAHYASNAACGYNPTSAARNVRYLVEQHQTDSEALEALERLVNESLELGWGHETPQGTFLSTKMGVLRRALEIAKAPYKVWGLFTKDGQIFCPPEFSSTSDLIPAKVLEGESIEDLLIFSLPGGRERTVFRNNEFKGCIGHVNHVVFENCQFYSSFINGEDVQYVNCTFHSELDGIILDYSTLSGCVFKETIRHASFYRVDIVGCFINDVQLGRLRGGEVRNSTIPEMGWSSISQTDMSNVKGERWVENKFEDCSFYDVRVRVSENDLYGQITIVRSRLGDIRVKRCKLCHEPHYNLVAGICPDCRSAGAYNTPNTSFRGKAGHLPTFSVEFETQECGDEENNPAKLLLFGFTAHKDSSVDVEYKSPIYRSMAPFIPALKVMDECAGWVGMDCGTHIHVGFNEWKRDCLNEHFSEIAGPMVAYMREHREETRKFWGRYFSGRFAASEASKDSRYVWLNTTETDKPTIEWRLPKFRNAAQFKAVVIFCRKASAFLEDAVHDDMTEQECARVGKRLLSMYKRAIVEMVRRDAVLA